MTLDARAAAEWFGKYLDMFAACGRGECDVAELLNFYAVPLLLTSDEGFVALTTRDQVTAAMQGQIDGLVAAGYHHSEVLTAEASVINAASALYRTAIARVRSNGTEVGRVAVTYLLTDGVTDGFTRLRISVLAAHSG